MQIIYRIILSLLLALQLSLAGAVLSHAHVSGEISQESWAEIVSVEIEQKALKAYNLTVVDFHTYFVRGAANDNAQAVWVHNDCFDINDFQRIHRDLDEVALNQYRGQSTDKLVVSLLNGAGNQRLQASRDDRIINGNHRIEALRERGYDFGNLRNQINSSHLHDTGNSFIPPGLE